MAKAAESNERTDEDRPEGIRGPDGKRFGPCGECVFYVPLEGAGASPFRGRCHGGPPLAGMWPVLPANALGCAVFRSRT